MITLRQLEAFCAVVESGSISVAAERLYLSQPAVSKIIASLEYRTQLTLFDREYRRIVPTAEARYLYKEARRLLAGLTDITRLAEELRTLNAGSVAIATLTAMGLQIVPSVLARFQQVRPNVDVTFQIRSPNKIMQWAIAQQIDFGIAITTMEHEAVSKETLCTTNGVCVMTQGHRLADRHRVDAADLHNEAFVTFVKEGFTRQALDRTFESLNVKPRCIAMASNSLAACTMVLQTGSVAVVDPYTALFFAPQRLVFRPFFPSIPYEFQLLWPRYRSRSKLVQVLVQEIRKELEEYDQRLEGFMAMT